MFYDLQWILEQNLAQVGSWASILALMASVYSFIWVRRTRLLLKRDREKHSLSLPQIHNTLQMVEYYLDEHESYLFQQSDKYERRHVRQNMAQAEFAVRQHLEKVFSLRPGQNAYVGVAQYYARLGQVDLAIFYYEKALACRQRGGFYLPGEHDAVAGAVSDCYSEVQACYLAVWQIKPLTRIARRAEREQIEDCLTPEDIESPKILLSCAGNTVRFLARDVIATITGKKGKIRVLN